MTDNPFVAAIERDAAEVDFLKRTQSWRRRFAFDARHSRSLPWYALGKRGHWSWTVTREQYKRFVRSEDPMLDFPDEIFEGWVRDDGLHFGWYGQMLSYDQQRAVFDRYIAAPGKWHPTHFAEINAPT